MSVLFRPRSTLDRTPTTTGCRNNNKRQNKYKLFRIETFNDQLLLYPNSIYRNVCLEKSWFNNSSTKVINILQRFCCMLISKRWLIVFYVTEESVYCDLFKSFVGSILKNGTGQGFRRRSVQKE